MLPAAVSHVGHDYDLQHLRQRIATFSWQSIGGLELHFSVRVRYSNHCISELASDPLPAGCFVFDPNSNPRVFDLDRYNWSLELPAIVDELFTKPTTSIQLTPEHNGYVFRLKMSHPLANGEKYYCFVRLRRSGQFAAGQHPLKLDLFIESAYARNTEPVRSNVRIMFGRLAEKLVL